MFYPNAIAIQKLVDLFLTIITDRKVQHATDGTTLDYHTADVTNPADYYQFGMQMLGCNGNVAGSGTYTPTTRGNLLLLVMELR